MSQASTIHCADTGPLGFLSDVLRAPRHVYPGYVAWRIKRALKSDDPERIIESVGDIETIGDCRYAISLTDHNGTKYRITVAVDDGVRS